MIKTKKLVPEIYYNRSRDFQLLGRIYDIVFNYMKMNSDVIYNNPFSDNSDDKLIALVSSTLGFKQTHEYNTKQLRSLCSTFVEALRNKGNLKSIESLLNLLANVENNTDVCYVSISESNPYLLNIYIPLSISDTSLFEDMLTYVLPAGMSYRLIRQLTVNAPETEEEVWFNLSDLRGEPTSAKIKINTNNQTIASQVLQAGDVKEIEQSTQLGVGRIEDMSVVKFESDEVTKTYVTEEQQDTFNENTEQIFDNDTTNGE